VTVSGVVGGPTRRDNCSLNRVAAAGPTTNTAAAASASTATARSRDGAPDLADLTQPAITHFLSVAAR
jgi:hypothetical protein